MEGHNATEAHLPSGAPITRQRLSVITVAGVLVAY
jgi:hypothetical protein